MRTHKLALAIIVLISATLLMMIATPSGFALQGVREDDMAIYYYATQEAAFTALCAREVDFILYDLTSAQADFAFSNPNIITCNVPDSGYYEFDLNNNYTISMYPGIRSPMNYSEMRQAIAFLSDKDYYVGTLYNNKAVRIDQMVAAPYYGWANASMSYPFYPYEYSPAAAKAKLDSKFPVGTTMNPYYDAGDPLSSLYLREYPADHPTKAGEDLDPMKFYVRVEHNARLMSGRAVYQALRNMGVPIDVTECPSSVSYTPVMGEFNYHFYTGGWSVGRFPPLSLYGTYHSINAFPYGGNYVTGGRFPFVGEGPLDPALYRGHPKLDDYLYLTNYAESYSDAVKYCKLAVGYMTDICVNVPLWSTSSYWAWCNRLLGVVNQQGVGPENDYTFMNAYKTDGSPIRCGTINYPTAINIVYSSWVYDYNNLDRMNLYAGTSVNPYDPTVDQPGFVKDWQVTTWMDGPVDKTMVHRSFDVGAYTAKPVSGDQGEEIDAYTYFWNAWLDYQIGDGWWSPQFRDLHHIEITGQYDFALYFDTYCPLHAYGASGPLRPMDLWMAQGDTFIADYTETVTAPAMPGAIPLTYDPIWFTSVTAGGTPLTFMTDYNIILGDLYILTPHAGDVVVTYWYVPAGALKGFFPGLLPWQTILEGAGQYYITSYSTTVSTFKRNPFYWMETPPLGEIDFLYHWNEGCYKVDELDEQLVEAAFGSQGTGIPSSNWFPGADLSASVGSIDLLDVTTVIGAHGTEWEYGPSRPDRNVAVTRVAPSTAQATIPNTVSINVTVENLGGTAETFDVEVFLSAYAGTSQLATQTVSNLAPGTNTTRTFAWNTAGYLTGPYKITALINKLANEANLNDNAYTFCMVTLNASIMHTLRVMTSPALQTLLPLTVNGTPIVAPWNSGLQSGAYTIEAPPIIIDGALVYHFTKWEDDTIDPTRAIQLTSSLNTTAYYAPGPPPRLTGTLKPLAEPSPIVYLSPCVTSALPFDAFTVNLTVADVENLYSWQLKLYYDTRFIDAYATAIIEGPFLQTGGSTVFQATVDDAYNATHGLIELSSTLTGVPSGVSGSGVLACVTLKTRAIGNGVAQLAETSLRNSAGTPLPHATLRGVGLIRIRMDADITNDGVVNIFDCVLVGMAYGSVVGQPKYNVHCDLIRNGAINIFDLVYLTRFYAQHETGYEGPIDRDPVELEPAIDGSRHGVICTQD